MGSCSNGVDLDNKYSRLLKNTGIVFVGNAGSKLLTFLMLPFYTKWLTPDEYGSFDLIFTYATLLLPVCFLCIVDAIFVFPSNKTEKAQSCYFCWGILFSVVMALISTALSLGVCRLFGSGSFFIRSLPAIMCILLATFAQAYLQQFARSIGRMGVFAVSGLIVTAVNCGLAFWLVPQYGVRGMVFSIIVAHVVSFAVTMFMIRGWRYLSVRIGPARDYLQPMLAYSIPMIPNAVMWWLIFSLSKPVIERCCGGNELGIYAFSSKVAGILAITGQILSSAWQCSILSEFGKDGYCQFYNRMLLALLIVQGGAAMAISLLSRECLGFVVDPKFMSAYRFIPFLCFSAVMAWHAGYVGTNFQAAKNSVEYLKTSLIGLAVIVVATFALVPPFGATGAVFASVLGNAAILLSRALKVEKYVHMTCWKPSVCLLSAVLAFCTLVLLPREFRLVGYAVSFLVIVGLLVRYRDGLQSVIGLFRRSK